MAVYTSTINKFDHLSEILCDGTLDLDAGNAMKCALILYNTGTNAPTGAETSFATYSSGKEISGVNGYTTGGVALTGVTWTRSGATTTFDLDNPSWTASGGNLGNTTDIGYWVIYDVTSDAPLFWGLLDDTPGAITVADTVTYSLIINASGLFTLS